MATNSAVELAGEDDSRTAAITAGTSSNGFPPRQTEENFISLEDSLADDESLDDSPDRMQTAASLSRQSSNVGSEQAEDDSIEAPGESEGCVMDMREADPWTAGTPAENVVSSEHERRQCSFGRLPDFSAIEPLSDIIERIPKLQDLDRKFINGPPRYMPTRENKPYVKRLTRAVHTYREARNKLEKNGSKAGHDPTMDSLLASDLRRVEVDLAWCQYFPSHYKFCDPPNPNSRRDIEASDFPEPLRRRLNFFTIVDKCLDEGTLLELQAGKFGGVDKVMFPVPEGDKVGKDLRKTERKQVLNNIKALEDDPPRKGPALAKTSRYNERLDGLRIDRDYVEYFPESEPYQSLRSFKEYGAHINAPGSTTTINGPQIWNYIKDTRDPSLLQLLRTGHNPNISIETGTQMNDSLPPLSDGKENQGADPKTERIQVNHDATRKDVPELPATQSFMKDVEPTPPAEIKTLPDSEDHESREIESGEVSAGSIQGFSSRLISESQTIFRTEEQKQANCDVNIASYQPSQPQKLADLNPEDLDAQFKYFHICRNPNEISLQGLARCICCGGSGHVARTCQDLTCPTCGAYNAHAPRKCSQQTQCTKCHENGHQQVECPYKLQRLTSMDKQCHLCNSQGHFADACELFWRTSGPPWEVRIDFSSIRLFCYECGRKGHLGNDCPLREPGKLSGTSTWSEKRSAPSPPAPQQPSRSKILGPAGSGTGRTVALSQEHSVASKDDRRKRAKLESKEPSIMDGDQGQNFSKANRGSKQKPNIQISAGIASTRTVERSTSQGKSSTKKSPAKSRSKPSSKKAPSVTATLPPKPPRPAPKYATGQPPYYADASRFREPDYEADLRYEYEAELMKNLKVPAGVAEAFSRQSSRPPPSQIGSHTVSAPARTKGKSFRPMPSAAKQAWTQFRR